MDELWQRIVENIFGRLDGPFHLRFIMQPLMATIFAVLDGLKDAKTDKPAYLWAVAFNPSHRRELLTNGWKSVGKIFTVACVLDIAYQLIIFHRIFPLEVLIVAFLLAIVPYALLRGPVNRVKRIGTKQENQANET